MSRSVYRRVLIPTDQSFLKQWFPWVRGKVSRRFRRDKERIPDTTQRVCVRLLQKEFIGRWFFKHLKDELVDLAEAERMLVRPERRPDGSMTLRPVKVAFFGKLPVARGEDGKPLSSESRSSSRSLWRVSDILQQAGFDHARYFYSIQGHTVDSDRVLELLNYAPGDYGILQSLWRQGRLLPAELTEHACPRRGVKHMSPGSCPECVRGLSLLRTKGVTLDLTRYAKWTDESVVAHVRKIRWNDSQLRPFLRYWNGNNVAGPPRSIMRPVSVPDRLSHVLSRDLDRYIDDHFDELADVKPQGIDAGLLKYAQTVVDNEVINDFKTLSRTDDLPRVVLNGGVSPEAADAETVAYDLDAEEGAPKIPCDPGALDDFSVTERRTDILSLFDEASLSDEEREVLSAVDLMEVTVREYAREAGVPVQRVHRVRTSALRKLRSAKGIPEADRALEDVCERHGCTKSQVLGSDVVGAPVVARTELFHTLSVAGMSDVDIAYYFGYPRERVAAAVARARSRVQQV